MKVSVVQGRQSKCKSGKAQRYIAMMGIKPHWQLPKTAKSRGVWGMPLRKILYFDVLNMVYLDLFLEQHLLAIYSSLLTVTMYASCSYSS